jgi:hypothetical protein
MASAEIDRKRKARRVIAVNNQFLMGVEIDEGDYTVLKRLHEKYKGDEATLEEDGLIHINPDDTDRRVRSLTIDIRDKFGFSCFLPRSLLELDALEKLDIRWTEINEFPLWLGELKSLNDLRLGLKDGQVFPPAQKTPQLPSLETLHVGAFNNIMRPYISSSIRQLENLKELKVFCYLDRVPYEIGCLSNLEVLDLDTCSMDHETFPDSIGNLKKLKYLRLPQARSLNHLPDSIWNLASLEYLHLKQLDIATLPTSIAKLKKLKCLETNGSFVID